LPDQSVGCAPKRDGSLDQIKLTQIADAAPLRSRGLKQRFGQAKRFVSHLRQAFFKEGFHFCANRSDDRQAPRPTADRALGVFAIDLGALDPAIPVFSRAGIGRQTGPARRHPRLYEQAPPCRKRSRLRLAAWRQPRLFGTRQRRSGGRLDGGPIRRQAGADELRGESSTGGRIGHKLMRQIP